MSRPISSADVFRAVADPTRRKILDLLRSGDRTAGELARQFTMSQPTISAHLGVLREAGLVRQRPAGRNRIYRLAPEALRPVLMWCAQYKGTTPPSTRRAKAAAPQA